MPHASLEVEETSNVEFSRQQPRARVTDLPPAHLKKPPSSGSVFQLPSMADFLIFIYYVFIHRSFGAVTHQY